MCYYRPKVLETEGGRCPVTHIIDSLTTFIQNLYVVTGLAGIVIAMAIESCCIPLPSEITMPLAGAMLAVGGTAAGKHLAGIDPNAPLLLNLLLLALAGSIGSLIGSVAAYGIGYAGGRPLMLKYGRYILISQHDADKADHFFQKWGSATAFFSRMMPVVRTYISLPAGITKMRFGRFCVYTFLGSLPWCFLLAYFGYVLGGQYDKISGPMHDFDIVIVLVLVVLVVLYVWRHIRNDRRARAEHAAAEANGAQQQPGNSWNNQPSMNQAQPQSGNPWGQPSFQAQAPMNQPQPGNSWGQPPVQPQQPMNQPQQQQWMRPPVSSQGQAPNQPQGNNWR